MENKRGQLKKFVLILIPVVIIAIIISIIYITRNFDEGHPVKQFIEDTAEKITNSENPGPDLRPSTPTTSSSSSSGGISGGGGGEGGGGGSSSSGRVYCEKQDITYSLLNIQKEETCNQLQGEICTSKTINCSIEIHNADDNYEGTFPIELNIYSETDDEYFVDTANKYFTIPPSDFRVFQHITTITSTGENGVANGIIKCIFHTTTKPYKEVCS